MADEIDYDALLNEYTDEQLAQWQAEHEVEEAEAAANRAANLADAAAFAKHYRETTSPEQKQRDRDAENYWQ